MTQQPLDDTDLIYLWQNYSDHRSRNQLTLRHTYIIYKLLPHYEKVGVPKDDLIQEGWRGLARAANDVDLAKGKYSTRAASWVREYMRMCVFDQKPLVHIPYGQQRRSYQLKRAKSDFLVRHQRNPTNEEMADKLNLTTKQIEKTCRVDQLVPSGDIDNVSDFSKVDVEKVWGILEGLHPTQRELLVRHFGIDNEPVEDLDKIGKRLGLRPQLIDRAYRLARENFREAYDNLI